MLFIGFILDADGKFYIKVKNCFVYLHFVIKQER